MKNQLSKKQKEERIKEESSRTLATYLRLLFETANKNYIPMGISTDAYELKVPYAHLLPRVLTEKGILASKIIKHTGKGRGRYMAYKWISTTEPSIPMARAIMTECQKNILAGKERIEPTASDIDSTRRDFENFISNNHPASIPAYAIKYPGEDPVEQLCSIRGETFYGVSRMMMQNGEEGTVISKGKLTGITITENDVTYHLDTMSTCSGIARSLSELESKLQNALTEWKKRKTIADLEP